MKHAPEIFDEWREYDKGVEAMVAAQHRRLAHHHHSAYWPPLNIKPRSARGKYRVRR